MAVLLSDNTAVLEKRDLRANRRPALNAWLAENDLLLDEYPFWSQADKDAEAAAFAKFDAEYEAAKTRLRNDLMNLTHKQLTEYFQKIGFDGLSESYTKAERVDDYMTRG